MWAMAMLNFDGRPAEYRWRRLFNAAKFGRRPLPECRACSNAVKTRNPLNLAGVPKTCQQISAVSGRSSPWRGYTETILLFNKLFSDCRYVILLRRLADYQDKTRCLTCEDIARQSCAMVRRRGIFGDFLGSCISSERAASSNFRPAF